MFDFNKILQYAVINVASPTGDRKSHVLHCDSDLHVCEHIHLKPGEEVKETLMTLFRKSQLFMRGRGHGSTFNINHLTIKKKVVEFMSSNLPQTSHV